jgi:ATP-dependent Clp protease ATP-binding subunit ClpA
LDGIIGFNALTPSVVASVVDKFVIRLEAQLEPKKVILVVDEVARHWLAQKGYDRLMGARPMERVIQEHIKKPLADAILFGELSQGGRVEISADDDGLTIEMQGTTEALPA